MPIIWHISECIYITKAQNLAPMDIKMPIPIKMATVKITKLVYAGLEIRGILVAYATMFSHLLPGFSCGSKHLLPP